MKGEQLSICGRKTTDFEILRSRLEMFKGKRKVRLFGPLLNGCYTYRNKGGFLDGPYLFILIEGRKSYGASFTLGPSPA